MKDAMAVVGKALPTIPLPVTSAPPNRRTSEPRLIVVLIALYLLGSHTWPLYKQHFLDIQITRNPAYLIEAQHGAVATENKRCSEIGVQVLKDGGNAVDAAISAMLCIGVVNMFSSGIGGGGFMTVRIPPNHINESSQVFNVDFRETAPALSHPRMYPPGTDTSRIGGKSVAVPGELRGMEEAYKRWGSLPWKRLFQPSIDLAAGWEVDVELGRRIPRYASLMLDNPDWTAIFAPDGVLLKEGELIRRTNYSKTLATIAEEGADAFYTGSIAESLVRKITATGGIMMMDDLGNYSVNVHDALQGTYRGRKIYTTHAPTSGPVLLHMFNLMEKYDLKEMNGLNVHRMIEAIKFGFASRTRICDPEFQNMTDAIKEMSTKAFADAISPNITDNTTHTPEYYNPSFDIPEDHGTSHASIIDKNGMTVSITSTVNLVFGSEVLDPETGVILNDEMDDFSVPGTPNGFGLWPSPYNYPEPGKRSLSSTVASVVENADGSVYLAIGGSGGSRIFPSVFQVLLNLDWGMDMSEAIEFGRLHDQLYPLYLDADSTYPKVLLDELTLRGHNVTVKDIDRVAAVINGVMAKDGKLYAASDSRKNGIAAGY